MVFWMEVFEDSVKLISKKSVLNWIEPELEGLGIDEKQNSEDG